MNHLFVFGLITLSQGLLMNFKDRCACNQYQEVICDLYPYCSWNGTNCVDLQCSLRVTQSSCSFKNSEFKCLWNEETNVCEDHEYECSELSEDHCELEYFGFHCLWYDGICQDYTCSLANKDQCSMLYCSYFNATGCGEPTTLGNCGMFTNASSCNQTDGQGQMCRFNNKNECKQYKARPTSCADYSDIPDFCQDVCTYDEVTSTCKQKTCSEIKYDYLCQYEFDFVNLGVIPCLWLDGICQDANSTGIANYNSTQCIGRTLYHYTWLNDQNLCAQCNNTVTSSMFDFLTESPTSAEIIFKMITILLLISLL